MATWVVDLGVQLYGKREFAVYDSVGDTFDCRDHTMAWCCWHSYDESVITEEFPDPATRPTDYRVYRPNTMSPWAHDAGPGAPPGRGCRSVDWILEVCKECKRGLPGRGVSHVGTGCPGVK